MRVDYHPLAEREAVEAVNRYAAYSDALGERFEKALSRVETSIGRLPFAGVSISGRLRRRMVPGFPFGLVYEVQSTRCLVVAVAHDRRRPGYWRRTR